MPRIAVIGRLRRDNSPLGNALRGISCPRADVHTLLNSSIPAKQPTSAQRGLDALRASNDNAKLVDTSRWRECELRSHVACPSCGASYQVRRNQLGRAVLCGKCQHRFLVPQLPAAEPAPTQPDLFQPPDPPVPPAPRRPAVGPTQPTPHAAPRAPHPADALHSPHYHLPPIQSS